MANRAVRLISPQTYENLNKGKAMSFHFDTFMRELRRRRGSVPSDLYNDLVPALEAAMRGEPEPGLKIHASIHSPRWLQLARRHMGLKEIPGRRHNSTILGWIRELGGWFDDDETPWCGTFVGAMIAESGLPVPKHWYRAREWAKWGRPCSPTAGAVIVFARKGGGHVGFLVGESTANYYVLGGNQSNQVNITPIAKSRALKDGIRWPAGMPMMPEPGLPRMSGGTVSTNEA